MTHIFRTVAFVSAFISMSAVAQPQFLAVWKQTEHAGVNSNAPGPGFFPAEVVQVMRRDGANVLVTRLGEQPSFEVRSQWENEEAKKPSWIPIAHTIDFSSFENIQSWEGESSFNSCSGGCDAGTGYKFSHDASFVATKYEGNSLEAPPTLKWSGHLFRWKNLLWLKPDHTKATARHPGEVLYIKDDGTLCTYVECFGNL